MRVYLCGPITGLSPDEAEKERNRIIAELADLGLEGVSPMRGKYHGQDRSSPIVDSTAFADKAYNAKSVFKRDRNDVKNCSLILANLKGAKTVSIGSMVELGWADAFGIPVIAVLEKGGMHDHSFVHQISTHVVDDIDDAISLCAVLLNA